MKISGNKPNEPFKIKGDWAKQSKQLKVKFPELTDSDLQFETGKEIDLIDKISARLNKKRFEVMNLIRQEQSEKL